MKSNLKKLFPKRLVLIYKKIKFFFSLLRFSYYDYHRFYKFSAAVKGDNTNKSTLISAITMDSHRIEKGLINKKPRLKFGLWFIPKLIENVIQYKELYGTNVMLNSAYWSIKNYESFHTSKNVELTEIKDSLDKITQLFNQDLDVNHSTFIYYNNERSNSSNEGLNFENLAKSRYSIRDFKNKKISRELILKAVTIAKKTPSVCNRQPWRVYCIRDSKTINSALKLQNGNLGFRNDIHNLLIVTGKLSYMRQPIERHQIYIDGGLFSMSLMYALHSLNIGSCPLNWCVVPKKDKQLRSQLSLAKDDEVIMYIAIGYLPDQISIASSYRMMTEELISFLD